MVTRMSLSSARGGSNGWNLLLRRPSNFNWWLSAWCAHQVGELISPHRWSTPDFLTGRDSTWFSPPLAVDGASVTVRKFTASHLTSAELVHRGALTEEAAHFLNAAVNQRMNILVSGGTGTGKTTMLNILSSHIDRGERVVTVEDAVELSLDLPNLIRLEARPANTEGAGQVTIRDPGSQQLAHAA